MPSVTYLKESIIRISIEYPDIRVENPNIYIVGSADGYSLIDCGGYDSEKDFRWLCNQLHTLGIGLSEIKRIFLTHTHRDHAFLAGRVAGNSDAIVYMGSGDYLRLSGRLLEYRLSCEYVKDYLLMWGFDKSMVQRFFRSFERQFYDSKIPEDRICLIDSEFRVGEFDILPSPGHTMGSICILLKDEGILFTGDTLIKKIVTVPVIESTGSGFTSSLTLHYNSLKRLGGIDFTNIIIIPGHGDVIQGGRSVIETIFHYIERRAERVLALVGKGKNNVYDIARSLYGRDVLYDVSNKEGPTVYVSDLMMPLEYLYLKRKILVNNGKILLC